MMSYGFACYDQGEEFERGEDEGEGRRSTVLYVCLSVCLRMREFQTIDYIIALWNLRIVSEWDGYRWMNTIHEVLF